MIRGATRSASGGRARETSDCPVPCRGLAECWLERRRDHQPGSWASASAARQIQIGRSRVRTHGARPDDGHPRFCSVAATIGRRGHHAMLRHRRGIDDARRSRPAPAWRRRDGSGALKLRRMREKRRRIDGKVSRRALEHAFPPPRAAPPSAARGRALVSDFRSWRCRSLRARSSASRALLSASARVSAMSSHTRPSARRARAGWACVRARCPASAAMRHGFIIGRTACARLHRQLLLDPRADRAPPSPAVVRSGPRPVRASRRRRTVLHAPASCPGRQGDRAF